MKEKLKNFLLKIKNSLCYEIKTPVYKLMLFCLIMVVLSCMSFSCARFVNSTLNDYSNNVENVETDINIIDRDIKGANSSLDSLSFDYIPYSTYSTYSDLTEFADSYIFITSVPPSFVSFIKGMEGVNYGTYYYGDNLSIDIVYNSSVMANYFLRFDSGSFYITNNSDVLSLAQASSYLYDSNSVRYNYDACLYLNDNFGNGCTFYNGNLTNFKNNIQRIGGLYKAKVIASDVDTSSLTLNETNFDGSVHFSTFLTKETISGYFSQLTYETTNFITPSLTLTDVDSYTIITGRIGSVPIANYIPSLVVVKYESKYVVYNYLRDNYLTPIYDTSTGVLDNVLGDGNYFLDVSSPTYFGSENDKFNLFISAVNIADSPLYSLISIGYNNGYVFGYGYGYNTGHQVGFADGEESGYNEGYDTGYENGFEEGRDTANALGPVMSLFKDTADVVASVLNVQILPNLTIGTILLFPLVALLFALFVRLFFGG